MNYVTGMHGGNAQDPQLLASAVVSLLWSLLSSVLVKSSTVIDQMRLKHDFGPELSSAVRFMHGQQAFFSPAEASTWLDRRSDG